MTLPKYKFESVDFHNSQLYPATDFVSMRWLLYIVSCKRSLIYGFIFLEEQLKRLLPCWINVWLSKCRLDQGRLWRWVPEKLEQNWEVKSFQTFGREGKGSAGQSGCKFRVRHQVKIWSSVNKTGEILCKPHQVGCGGTGKIWLKIFSVGCKRKRQILYHQDLLTRFSRTTWKDQS